MRNNKIIVDLSKVQYAWQSWVTMCGNYKRQYKPEQPTVHGQEFDCEAPVFNKLSNYTTSSSKPITLLEFAKNRCMLDVWIPCTTLQLTANHRLTYTGEKAQSIWKAYCERVFNKKGKR